MRRIYHTWDKWECYPAGFYDDHPPRKDLSENECISMYAEFLRDTPRFEAALVRVTNEWVYSCEHYLTNERMNRIAWLGQAAMCITTGVPSRFRGGFNLLSKEEQETANKTALEALNAWLFFQGHRPITMEEAQSKTQMDLY